jgi:hypothetical protein
MAPCALHPAEVKNGVVKLVFRKSGDLAPGGMYKIDNLAFRTVQQSQINDLCEAFAAAAPGTHTVTTCRADARGVIEGSELSFTYFVGHSSPPIRPTSPGSKENVVADSVAERDAAEGMR